MNKPSIVSGDQTGLQRTLEVGNEERQGGAPSGSPGIFGDAEQSRSSDEVSQRARRAHKKSRFGCKNCKGKRLKCDESRQYGGGCWRCKSNGLECSYILTNVKPWISNGTNGNPGRMCQSRDTKSNDGVNQKPQDSYNNITTSPSHRTESSISLSGQQSPLSLHIMWSPPLPVSNFSADGMPLSQQVLHHFATATALEVGNSKSSAIAQSEVVSSALSAPYLMHAILGLAAAHIRCLMPSDLQVSRSSFRVAECFHWAKALEGFRCELAGSDSAPSQLVPCRSNVKKENMDQLLSTVMFVSMHQFSLRDDSGAVTDASSAPRSFVWLRQRSERDAALQWLGIQAGFKGLIEAMGPWLGESFWLPIIGEVDYTNDFNLKTLGEACNTDGNCASTNTDPVEAHFVKLCGIDKNVTEENPYYSILEIVLWCRRMQPINAETFPKLLNFVARMNPQFQALLLDLDTAALLVLAHWLVLMLGVGHWWITSRALVEIREIVRFVRQRNAVVQSDQSVEVLLCDPAAAVGMDLTRFVEDCSGRSEEIF